MTSPRDQALEDLLRDCRALREDPNAALRVIERVEEIDHLSNAPVRKPLPEPPPKPEPCVVRYDGQAILQIEAATLVQGLAGMLGMLFLVLLGAGLMVLGAYQH